MSHMRQNRSDQFRNQLAERGNPHGGRGRRAENNIAEQFEMQTNRTPNSGELNIDLPEKERGGNT